MIKITALLLAVLLSLAIIPTIGLTVTKAQNDTNATEIEPGPGFEFPPTNVTEPAVNATDPDPVLGNENTTTPDCLTEPCDPATGLPVENVTAPPASNVTEPPLEETLPPGNVSQSEPTAIQIQLIPNIQRGHNQHMTLFLVDDVGSVVPDELMQGNITTERGQLVGLKSFTTESGKDHIYKVGPNTRPQNITVFAQLPDTNITAQEEYSVFAKITAPTEPNNTQTEPEPVPPTNITAPIEGNVTLPVENQTGGNTTAPPVNITAPIEGNITAPIEGNITAPPQNSTITPPGNETGNGGGNTTAEQPPANATSSFEKLENSTAILEQEIAQGDENGNETDRAEVKGAVSETLSSLGDVASEVATATNFQLGTIGATAEAVADAIDQILN